MLHKKQKPKKEVSQKAENYSVCCIFFFCIIILWKKKKQRKKKNNSSPLTTKWFTKVRALLQEQESTYLEKVKSKDKDQMKLNQWPPFQFGVELTVTRVLCP